MYSTYNERKSVSSERFIRTLIFKHMTAISKNVYFDALDDIDNKYYNTVHRTIKIKPIDVTSNCYAKYNEHSNENEPNFNIGDRIRISNYKNIFAKGYTQNWSEKIVIISEIKNTVPWTYVISDLNGEKIDGTFYEKRIVKNKSKEIQNRKDNLKKR